MFDGIVTVVLGQNTSSLPIQVVVVGLWWYGDVFHIDVNWISW